MSDTKIYGEDETLNVIGKEIDTLVNRRFTRLFKDILKKHPNISLIELQVIMAIEVNYVAAHFKLSRRANDNE